MGHCSRSSVQLYQRFLNAGTIADDQTRWKSSRAAVAKLAIFGASASPTSASSTACRVIDSNALHFLNHSTSQSNASSMPRNLHITAPFQQRRIPAILRTQLRHPKEVIKSNTPRLWNAKRRIKHSWGLNTSQWGAYKYDPKFDWRSKVSPDVVEFIDKNPNLLPEEKAAAIFNPSRYFSRPHHVPEEQRKQIYLPTFSVTFIRTPQHGPFYAHFEVPIWFNKLDMKSYLKNVYSVEVVHIRSYVTHGKKDHHSAHRPGSEGPAFRQPRKKRMTVQLVEPFQWPEEPKDFSE